MQEYEYRAEFNTKTCYREPLKYPFHPFNISLNARYVDSLVIGSNAGLGTGLEVQIWEGEDLSELNDRVVHIQ